MVGSSRKTSSRRVQFWVAASMEAVGVVTVSPGRCQLMGWGGEERYSGVVLRKSKAAEPGVDQASGEERAGVVWSLEKWPLMPLVLR